MPGAAPTSKKSACPVRSSGPSPPRPGSALPSMPPLADLAHMQSLRLHSYKDLRLDDGITGADLTRPGFLAVSADALSHKAISHLFIYKRDRFARPQDAMQAAQIEKRLLTAGITIVFSDTVSAPIRLGEQTIMRDLELLLPYYQGGEELRKHAERMLGFQKVLAEGGFRVGGNAAYGFVRVLVDNAGKVLEELPPGKTVRAAGLSRSGGAQGCPEDRHLVANPGVEGARLGRQTDCPGAQPARYPQPRRRPHPHRPRGQAPGQRPVERQYRGGPLPQCKHPRYSGVR